MPEAVIVAAARSPIGRASKGSLVECRPDDLTATIVHAVLAKVPQLDPGAVQDLMLGCGEPAGESGFNLARVVAILAGMPDVRESQSTATALPRCGPSAWLSTPSRPVKGISS